MVQSLTCLILKKKNSLSKIWLSAHWDKKLSRYQILQIDIERCVRDIIHQEIILDLRLSGHLLIGIVKIFSRKTTYLLSECTDITSRVRVFQPHMTELCPNKLTAPMKLITLPEIFEFKKMDEDDVFNSLQSHVEDITLKETAYDTRLINDDEHFDILGEENIPMDFEENVQLASLLNDEVKDQVTKKDTQALFFGEYCNGVETENRSYGSSSSSPAETKKKRQISDSKELAFTKHHISETQELILPQRHISGSLELIPFCLPDKIQKSDYNNKLNLVPLSSNFHRIRKTKSQKRKLIIDEVKSMSREKLEKQIQEFSNLVYPLDLAPPSKRLMILKEIGSVEQLLHQPGQKVASIEIKNRFKKNMRICKTEEMVDDSISSVDSDLSIPLEDPQRKLFLDGCATTRGFDEQDFLFNEISDQHGLLNEDVLPEIALNSDSSTNDVGDFNEQRNSLTEDVQLSIEFQQDSGRSSNGVSSICQEKIIKFLRKLKLLFKEWKEVKFSNLVLTNRKIKVAHQFHSLLMIKKFNIVEIKQAEPYGEILITKGENFVAACEDIY